MGVKKHAAPFRTRKSTTLKKSIRIRPEVLEMLRRGAEYHGIGYQTYLQWLVEEGLKSESKYYGWAVIPPSYTTEGPTVVQQREIDRLTKVALRRARKKKKHGTTRQEG